MTEYDEIDCTIEIERASYLALIIAVPLVALLAGGFVWLWGWPSLRHGLGAFYQVKVFIPALLIGVVVHEWLHGIVWAIAAGRPFSSIAFGIQWKTLTPYAHSKEPMKAGPYRAGALAPFVGTAVLPAIYALASGNGAVLAATLFFGAVCGGDLVILWLLRRVRMDDLVQDHPKRGGCTVLRPRATEPA
jgi:hypothetical protein